VYYEHLKDSLGEFDATIHELEAKLLEGKKNVSHLFKTHNASS
jgi:hypothetical protein